MILRRLYFSIAAGVFALGLCTAPALSDTHKFKIDNQGGHQVDRVYLSPISSRRWGPDQMGSDVLGPNQSQTWDIDTNCEMDVKIVYHDGHVITESDVDTCQNDLVLHY